MNRANMTEFLNDTIQTDSNTILPQILPVSYKYKKNTYIAKVVSPV